MLGGYKGRILRIDLQNSKTWVEESDELFYRKYLGGRGIGAYYLLQEVPMGIDAFDPENKLVFSLGAVTGTPIPGSSRFTVTAKSPLTGGYGEADAGGFWGAALKKAGYDGIVIGGRSPHPVYIYIDDEQVEIRNAEHLWGKPTAESQEIIHQETNDRLVRVAQIGPAGENLVRYACIVVDLKHVLGRTGMGAVMGSKNLKAVAVRGRARVEINDPSTVRELTKWFADNYLDYRADLHDLGTSGSVIPLDLSGALPTNNFQRGTFAHAEDISGEVMARTIKVGQEGCYACPVQCKKLVRVEQPYDVNPAYGGPEYETIAAFGSNCGIQSLETIAKANELCNAYGMDTISTGVTIAFAMECYEKGVITDHDTDGLTLTFGNDQALLQVVNMIANRQGIGDILAEGTRRASRHFGYGTEEFAMHVKGQELPLQEPRVKYGVALAYATSPTGADHMQAAHDPGFEKETMSLRRIAPLGVLEPIPSTEWSWQKVRFFVYLQDWYSCLNSMQMCLFVTGPHCPFDPNQIVEMVRAVTGWNTSLWELMKIGERNLNMARAFNAREGSTRQEDTLPKRLFTPLEGSSSPQAVIREDEFESALTTYYEMRGWDPISGHPGHAKLQELSLDWVAERLGGSYEGAVTLG